VRCCASAVLHDMWVFTAMSMVRFGLGCGVTRCWCLLQQQLCCAMLVCVVGCIILCLDPEHLCAVLSLGAVRAV
jgi:hypothetical protein